LWRARALRVARTTARATELERLRLRRAHLAAELAERALEPVEPLAAGPGHALAISLYREAAYWALLAQKPELGSPGVRELLSSQPDAFARSGLSEADQASVREALADKTFIETADDSPARLAHDSELCRAFVRGLLHGSGGAVDLSAGVSGLLTQRWLRLGAALTLAAAIGLAAASGIRRVWIGPDLAEGAPWILSTKWMDCHPEQRECGGARTRIFFHTDFQDNPWFQLDLGRVREVGRVRVENRDDCCQERAVPLIVEVRDDTGPFREVARKNELFQSWEVTFPAVKARYVRLRVPTRVMFHLSRVEVRRR
jgi:hypothetical protein